MSNDIRPGDRVRVGGRVGDVIRVDHFGQSTQYTIFFEGERPRPILVPPNTIEKISDPLSQARAGHFDPPWKFHLLTQAVRLSLAYEHHHLLSLSNSRTDLQPYQVEAVYRIIGAPRQRFLIADEVGLGKTIEAGMVLKELEARKRAGRVLIVTPSPLTDQWRREMGEKFGLRLHKYDSSQLDELRNFLAKNDNPWDYHDRIVTSMDFAKQEHVLAELRQSKPWGVLIFDEAHNLGVSKYGNKINRTQRYRLAEEIAPNSDAMLLLTATPHKGDDFAFWNLINLIDPYLFPTPEHLAPDRVAKIMIRRIKDNLRDQDGAPVFRPRTVDVIPVEYSAEEMRLYETVTRYVSEEYNLARNLDHRAVGFAMVILQKRMVSSIAAIRKSLWRRVRNLLKEEDVLLSRQEEADLESLIEEPDTLTETRAEELTQRLEQLTLHTGPELHQEITRLNELCEMAKALKVDSKAAKLLEFIRGILKEDPQEKIIVFTEYRDTLDYIYDLLLENGFQPEQIATIHGGMSMPERQTQEAHFAAPGVPLLLATDAASEGINLQFCHILVNYELPWNPNRIDQRIGRVHRYGQQRDVRIYNLLVRGTREGDIFIRLQQKIRRIERQLQGQVTDVLGNFLEGVNLTEIIMRAVGENIDIEVTDWHLERAIQERMRTWQQVQSRFLMPLRNFDLESIQAVIDHSESITASNDDIERFVRTYFKTHDGKIENTRHRGVYRLTTPKTLTPYPEVSPSYSRVAFQKEVARRFRPDEVDFIAFGHPLLEAIVKKCRRRDEGFGGAVGLERLPAAVEVEDGVLFNFVLRYTDAGGDILSEDFLPVYITLTGDILPYVGEKLVNDFSPSETASAPESGKVVQIRENINKLYAIAFDVAQKYSRDHSETVREQREREVNILLEDLERWYQANRETHDKRLRDYRQRLLEGEDMNIAIRGEERRLQDIQDKYESRRAELENQRAVVSQAPELLNLALWVR